jgi:lichenan operon transcriptional antiterminator
MQSLTINQKKMITHFINTEKGISSRDIQEICKLSRKTIIAEIKYINMYLEEKGAIIETIKGKYYSIKIKNREKYEVFRDGFLSMNQRNRYLYIEKNCFVYQIMTDLIIEDDYITIDDLVNKYYYSRGTVTKNLREAKRWFAKFNCSIISMSNHGSKVVSSEWSKRLCIIFLDEIANRLEKNVSGFENQIKKSLGREKYNLFSIESLIGKILWNNAVSIPFDDFNRICLYIIISQERMNNYDLLNFEPGDLEQVKKTRYFMITLEFVRALAPIGLFVREMDTTGLAIMLSAYTSNKNTEDINRAMYNECLDDTRGFINYIENLYIGIENTFDKDFTTDFVRVLSGMKERLHFLLPIDEESAFHVKQDGLLLLDLCRDFADFYEAKYKILLPESELLNLYFIFSNSRAHWRKNIKHDKAMVICARGIDFARNIGERILSTHQNSISEIVPAEYNDVKNGGIEGIDLIITDIEPKHFSFTSVTVIPIDFFRESNQSNMLSEYLPLMTKMKLNRIIKDSYIVRDLSFSEKGEVFKYIAQNHIHGSLRENFIRDCVKSDSITSYEKCNRIAMISINKKYFNQKEILFLFSKPSFMWNNELVELIIFFTNMNRDIIEIHDMDRALACFLHSRNNIAEILLKRDAEGIVNYIVDYYKATI